MPESSLSIDKDFVVVRPDKSTAIESADAGLYERLADHYQGFEDHVLVSCHDFEQDWGGWEIHPHGDETVILLSGKATLVLESESGVETVHLEDEGAFVIVPRNVWHTAKTGRKTRLLFITPGEGTRYREA